MPTNFDLAPPAKLVDGLLAVPIDISTITAAFTFDGALLTASADATIDYEVGPTAGNPIFDLRQTVTQAWLDGTPFPVGQLSHHVFGSDGFTDLRVVEALQSAGSVHTLRLTYGLSLPASQLGGSYLPALEWSAGPRLRFVFGLSDLNRARYAEAWLPANLPFDQFGISLVVRITNTVVPHEVITNGDVALLGPNHWSITFPDRCSSVSPMLEVRASDTLVRQSGTTTLPVSGAAVTIETWKPTGSAVDLATQIASIASLLGANETRYGAYLHGDRFVAFFNGGGGMEYEGGTTTSTGALLHETFHSWFGRGVKPASQADGWWDEGYASFHDSGADDTLPFDFSDPPVVLCSRDPWQRHTPASSYADGERFWQGMAALLGVAALNGLLAEIYQNRRDRPLSTQTIEEFLLCRSGRPETVDAFHRFVYGLGDPSSAPDLWIRDASGHTGTDHWDGAFWDSPDLWIRTSDDDGTTHQSPEYGRDNWFHARVRNRGVVGTAQHFVVTFHTTGFLGMQFDYPADFLPCTAAKAEFELAPGATRVVKARWPRALVPPPGSHTCLLASVITRGDHPPVGPHVWEHNNLAQKNLAIVDLVADELMIVPIVIANRGPVSDRAFELEVWRREESHALELGLLHRSRSFFQHVSDQELRKHRLLYRPKARAASHIELECGAHIPSRRPGRDGHAWRGFDEAWEAPLDARPCIGIPIALPEPGQRVIGLLVKVGRHAQVGTRHKLHVVQRDRKRGDIVGGVALEVHIGSRPDIIG